MDDSELFIPRLKPSDKFEKLFFVTKKRHLKRLLKSDYSKESSEYILNSVLIIRECLIDILQNEFNERVESDCEFDPEDLLTMDT